jgi:hypothetical protein
MEQSKLWVSSITPLFAAVCDVLTITMAAFFVACFDVNSGVCPMHFEVQGPFELDRTRSKLVDNCAETKRYYWEWVDEHVSGLSNACGCYIFAIQASRGTLPWYVGKAEKQPFKKECLSHHKLNHYNNAVAGRRGKPCLFFLPQLTNSGSFRKPTSSRRKAISELESLLIGMAIARNPGLLNSKGTKWVQEMTVDGLINSRRTKTGPARDLSSILRL